MPFFLIVNFGYLALLTGACMLIGITIERAFPGPERPAHRSIALNSLYAVPYTIIQSLLVPLVRILPIIAIGALGGALVDLPDHGIGLAGSTVLFVLTMDLGEYLFHRLQHVWRPLWLLHALHHSDPDVNVTTTLRHSWTELLLKALFVSPLVALLMKPGPHVLAIYSVFSFYNYVPHMSTRLSLGRFWPILNGPGFHRLHHSIDPADHGCNYAALFPIFDLISGTARPPMPGYHPRTGLDDVRAPDRLVSMLAWPLLSGQRSAFGIMKNDSEREALASANATDAMTQAHPIPAAAARGRTVIDREDDHVALPQGHDLDA
jgi:sterol desaturase/sphingolipid hydroxylase (fatty acid hydroxylase superfamily)